MLVHLIRCPIQDLYAPLVFPKGERRFTALTTEDTQAKFGDRSDKLSAVRARVCLLLAAAAPPRLAPTQREEAFPQAARLRPLLLCRQVLS